MAHDPKPRKESLFERRTRVEKRLLQQRVELAEAWRALERQTYVQERRITGITRGFRAVLPLGALGGAVWLLRRYGPVRLVRPAMFGIAVWKYLRRFLDFRAAYQRGT